MLSPKPPIPFPHSAPQPTNSTSRPWHSPVLGHMIIARTRASPPIDGQLVHPLLHMQLETQFWGLLVSSYCCSTYRVADPFCSLGIFSSSFIRDPVFHPIDDREHPLHPGIHPIYNHQTQILLHIPEWFCWQDPDIAIFCEAMPVPGKYRSGCSQSSIG